MPALNRLALVSSFMGGPGGAQLASPPTLPCLSIPHSLPLHLLDPMALVPRWCYGIMDSVVERGAGHIWRWHSKQDTG